MPHFPGLADEIWRSGYVVCAQLCDWIVPHAGDDWIEIAESIAATLGVTPSRGYAFSGARRNSADLHGPRAKGAWKRIRQRAANLLGEFRENNVLELNTDYVFTVGEGAQDAYLALSKGTYFPNAKSRLSIAVSQELISSPDYLAAQLAPLLRNVDAKWGAVFRFPFAAGAGFYLNGTAYVGPEIRALGAEGVLAEHQKRLHRATYRTSSGFSYAAGYVREVYEINFLTEAHLHAPLLGSTVRQYARSIGTLETALWNPEVSQWYLTGDELTRARVDWERSGLVLAAEANPFRWQ
jgi:hypothetical protein